MEDLVIPTPDYKLQETSTEIILTVSAPLCRSSDITVFLEKKIITFEAHPYFLKLKLPCRVSSENNTESFDDKNGTYTLTLIKKVGNDEESDSESEEYALNEHTSHCNTANETDNTKPYYGFANLFSGKFGPFYKEFSQVIDLEDPDGTKEEDRACLRQKEEAKKWNEDHYLADLMDNERIKPLLKYTLPWCSSNTKELNEDEKYILDNTPTCEGLETGLPHDKMKLAELQMVDILLSYCYNKRTTEGENTVESAWTINKLSSCLSWLEVSRDLKSVIQNFYRRSLTYPLYRNWELTEVIHEDVVTLLKLGANQVTRCFIEIKELFDESENRYILNTLFIDPLCHFSHSLSHGKLEELANAVETVKIKKEEVHEDLLVLEMAANAVLEEENMLNDNQKQMNEITEKVLTMNFNDSDTTSSDSEDEDGSSSDS